MILHIWVSSPGAHIPSVFMPPLVLLVPWSTSLATVILMRSGQVWWLCCRISHHPVLLGGGSHRSEVEVLASVIPSPL